MSYSNETPEQEWPPPGTKEALILKGMNRAQRRQFIREHRPRSPKPARS